MCPSTPATSMAAVSVAHWMPFTSHSCEVSVAIRADCECVVQISTSFYPHIQPSGFLLRPTRWNLVETCAAHVNDDPTEPIGLRLSLQPSTGALWTASTISPATVRAAHETLPRPSPS